MKQILTESRNENTKDIDLLSAFEIVQKINDEDKKVALAIEKELHNIAKAVEIISEKLTKGGKLIYFGAGTSGRLGVLDASECPPTFNTDLVEGYIAGGDKALRFAMEGAEDCFESGEGDVLKYSTNENDVIVAISASGNAKYLIGVLSKARQLGRYSISVVCNKKAKLGELSDIMISPEVGAEAVTGSTRMKAGSAQKMVLNMLSTASMVKLGKTYENYMIDLNPTNDKLKDRATRIVEEIANVNYEQAQQKLIETDWNVKISCIVLAKNIPQDKAKKLLAENDNILRGCLR